MEISPVQLDLSERVQAIRAIQSSEQGIRNQLAGGSRALDLASKFPPPTIDLSEGANLGSLDRSPGRIDHLIQEYNPQGFRILTLLSATF